MNAAVCDISRHRQRLLLVREEVSSGYGADWKRVDARVIELGREGAKHNREVCRWLAEAARLGVPGRLGFAGLREYAERRVGLMGRDGEERVRVGKALADLPGLDEAFWRASARTRPRPRSPRAILSNFEGTLRAKPAKPRSC